MLDIVKSFKENGWIFKYEPSTKCINAYHAKGGKQSICEMISPAGKDELGLAIAEFLKKSPEQLPIDANIDWALLRKQKKSLMEVTIPYFGETEDNLTGILHLIDNIQDSAVESGKWTEKEVFG